MITVFISKQRAIPFITVKLGWSPSVCYLEAPQLVLECLLFHLLLIIGSLLSSMLETCLRELGRDRTSVSSSTSRMLSLVIIIWNYLTCVLQFLYPRFYLM